MNYKQAYALFLFLFLGLTAASASYAQTSGGTIAGRVSDANGAGVAGASVELTNLGTNAAVSVETNDEGFYVAPELQPGNYRVRASKSGFQTAVREPLALNVSANVKLNFTLQAGEITETVTVEADARELVETDSAAVGTLVDRKFVENLPLNGRSFQSLIELTPGVVAVPSTIQNSGQFSVNGQRSNANYFTVDGVSGNIGTSTNFQFYQQAAGTLPGLSIFGGTNTLASVDAVQEFRVLTSSYEAEHGRQPGGQIEIITRRGTNDFSFTAFDYVRNDKFDANDFFDNLAGRPRRKLRQNDFGFVAGGPVFLPRFGEGTPFFYDGRNRTFFFVSYEGLRLVQPQPGTLIANVPSLAARAAAPPNLRAILNAFPLPNAPRGANDPADTERYVSALSYPSQVDATAVRLDHQLTKKISLFGRYNTAPSSQTFRAFASQENFFSTDIETLTVGSNQILSSKIVNDLRFNYSNNDGAFEFRGREVDGAVLPPDSLLFPSFVDRNNAAVSIQLSTQNNAASVSSANLTQGKTVKTRQRQFQFVDTLSIIAGRHQLKFGADYRRLLPRFDSRSIQVSYVFGTPASRASGVPTSISVQAFAPNTGFYVENLSLFGQDTWRVNNRLTVTYGLRWEYNPPLGGERLPYAAQGLENPLTATLAPAGTKQWKTEYDNFAPRFGIAYTLSEKQNAVIRAGFGIYYDLGTGTALRGFNSFPYSSFKTLTGSQLRFPANEIDLQPVPFLDTQQPPYSSSFVFFDPNLKLPYTRQWNVSFEKGFGENQTVTVSYVGAQGRKLLRAEQLRNYNAAFVQQRFGLNTGAIITVNPAIFGLTPAQFASSTPLASSDVSITRNAASSDYHALQTQYQRRLSRGLQVLASYTFSRAIDDVSDETTTGIPPGQIDLRVERGRAAFDVPHNFTAAVSYDLPRLKNNQFLRAVWNGWGVDTVARFRSGLPFSVITQNFDQLNIGATRRVDVVAGQPLWIEDAAAPGGRRLNPLAFVAPAAGRQGSLERNSLRSFSARQIDLALRRTFGLGDKFKLQIRGEAFNLLNWTNFGFPSASCGSNCNVAGFGVPTSTLGRSLSGNTATNQTGPSAGFNSLYQTGGPRSLQFALKLIY
jgi:hypothetical protein